MLPGRNNNKFKRPTAFGRKNFFYSKKTYNNPFFKRKRAGMIGSGGLSNRNKLIIFAAAVAAAILIWLLFFSTLFKINIIEISGVSGGLAAEIETAAWKAAGDKLLGENNLLLFGKKRLEDDLNEKYYLESLIIDKKIFHTLKITLKEKERVAVWREDDKYYYLDGEGSVISQVDPLNIRQSGFPFIENMSGVKIEGRQTSANQTLIGYILGLFNEFKNKNHGFEIERFIVDGDANTVKLAVLAGPKIYFNIKEEIGGQSDRLDLIIKEKLKNNFNSKEYIDLRYGNNIYIK